MAGFVGRSFNLYNRRLRRSDPHRITYPTFEQSTGKRRHVGNSAATGVRFVLTHYAEDLLTPVAPLDRNGVTKLDRAVRFWFRH